METKMGLNARDIQFRLLRVLHVSIEISYSYMQKHPMVSGALLIFFILYIFLSYIYSLLLFLSPFLVCIAIFVRIFWSSEQNHSKCVKREEKKKEEKKVEFKCPPKMITNERRGLLYKCPSQNATSRRRNFTRKKLDVYGGLEIKAKDLSAVFHNEFTKRSTKIGRTKLFEKEIGSLEAPTTKQTLFSEPSMLDLVTYGASCDGQEKKVENMEDEKKAQEDKKKGVELGEDDKKYQMDLGIGEVERNRRLESLIARRRARKQLKLQIENGLIDMKSVIPSQIAPLFVTRVNPFDSPREFEGFDGIKMPGSAPSALRSPFDIPYDPFEERPNLTGDGFALEFTSHQKDMSLEPRQEDIGETQEYKLRHPSFRSLQGEGNHDKLEQLISKEASESESKDPIPPSDQGEETTLKEEGKCEIDMAGIKGEEGNNVEATKSMSNHTSKQETTTTNSKEDKASEKAEPKVSKPQETPLNLPISNTNVSKINDSLYESLSSPPVDEKQENMLLTGGLICHTPSCSLASDLQVEVSEVGSPTLTVDESHETNTTTDGESMLYDGDIDKDVTSESEDMWGASLHSREVRRVSEQDISEVNNWRDIGSPFSQQNMDEENAADVSSMSSRSDMLDDTPTYATSNVNSIFSDRKDNLARENGAPQPSSEVLKRWKRLMKLMDTHVNHLPPEMHSKRPAELFNLSENLSKAQVINDVNAPEQDNSSNSRSNEEPRASIMQQEATNEVSNNSSSSSSPRSVLSMPQKTIANQDSFSSYNQEIQLGVQQSNMHNVTQEIPNGEAPLDSTSPNIQSLTDDRNVESHNGDLNHCKEQTYHSKDSIQEPNISSKMSGVEVCNNEDEKKLKNDKNKEEKSSPLIRQDASAEPSTHQAEMMALKDVSEKSRESFDDKVPLISLILESTSEEATTTEQCINAETTDTSFDEDLEGKHNNLNKNEAILSSCILEGESDKLKETDRPKHSLEKVNYLQNESNEDHVEKEKLDKVDISNDLPLPIDNEVINSKDTKGEYDKMNKNEVIDQELDKNETLDLSRSGEEIDKVTNIEHAKDHEEKLSS